MDNPAIYLNSLHVRSVTCFENGTIFAGMEIVIQVEIFQYDATYLYEVQEFGTHLKKKKNLFEVVAMLQVVYHS